MRIFSKTKATLALLAAVLVAGFAFAKTVEKSTFVWNEGKTFEVDAVGTLELTGMTAAAGDKLVIYYEQAGSAAQGEARAAAPMRDAKRYADLRLFVVDETNPVVDKDQLQGEGTEEYTFTAAVAATDKVIISARNLTITKVEVVTGIEVAEQLTNADFSQGAALDNHLCGYGKDMAGQNTTYYGLQDVEGWTKVVVAGDNSNASFPNSGMGGGVFAYGSEWQMKGNSKTAPAAGPNGEAGQALGFFAIWSCGGYYYQDIVLPAGKYTFMTYIYNQSGTQANTTQTGFFVNGEAKATVAINTAVGQWTLQTADFELTEETVGQVRVGYVSTGGGSGANQMLFFDYVKVLSELDAAIEAYDAALAAANAAASEVVTGEENQTLAGVIAANSNIDKTSVDAVKAATNALNEAVTAYQAAIPAYQALADAKALVNLEAWPYAAAAKKTAVETAAAATATSADDATAKKDALLQAYRAYVESNATAEGVEGAQVVADAITNPAAEDGTNGWTTVKGEGSGGSLDVKSGEPWTDASDNATHKYFDGGNWGANSWDVSLTQDITLASGKYVLTAIVRASTNVALTLFAGENKAQATVVGSTGNVFNRGWNDVFVAFDQAAEGTVTIGVQGVTSNQHEWMSFSNFRLVRLGDIAVDEAVAKAREALQAEIDAAKAMKDAEGTYDEGKTELAAAIEAAEGKLTSTDADELATALNDLKAAEEAFKQAQAIAANAAKVADASATTPVTTDFIENGFFDSDTHAWQSTGNFQNKGTATNQAGAFTGKFWENWNPEAKANKMYQVVENIPNGLYKLKIAAFVNKLADAPAGARGPLKVEPTQTVQFVFANADKAYLTTGEPTFYEVYTTVTDNKVEVGLEQTEAVANWMGIDNATLTYYGAETTVEEAEAAKYDAAYNELKDARQSVKTKTELDAAYQAYKAGASAETIAALETAIAASRASVNSYKILEAGVLPDNSLEGWTCTNTNTFHINTWSVEGNSDGTGMVTPFIENWVYRDNVLGQGEIYYTLPGLDPGIYSFSALIRAYSESGNPPAGASLFAGNREVEFATGKNFEYNNMKGIYDNYAMAAEVGEDGIFRFGVKISAEVNFNWMAFKNCKVAYVGAAIDAAAVAALAETMPEGKMNADVKAAMDAAKATAETTPNLENYEAFQKAIAAAQASVAAYAKLKAVLDELADVLDKTNVYTAAAKATFDEKLQDTQNGYDDGSLTDAEANAFNYGSRLEGLLPELLLSAYTSPVEGTPYINTWSVEGNTDGSEFRTPFYEYWTGDANSLGANTITAELVGLEAGEYEVTALVRVRLKNNVTDAPAGITMKVNEGEAVNVCEGGTAYGPLYVKEYTAKGTVNEDGALKIVFDVAADNNISWLSFKNVKYVKTGSAPAEPITIPTTWNFSDWKAETFTETTTKDGLTIAATADKSVAIDGNKKTVENVEYTQRLKLGGTGDETYRNLSFAVPGPCDIEVVLMSSSSSADRTLNIDAGTFGNTITTMEALGAECKKQTYTYTGEATTLYLYSASSGINIYAIYVKEANPTGISTAKTDRQFNGTVYNLRGQRVDNPTKGLYIIGGKKVVIK